MAALDKAIFLIRRFRPESNQAPHWQPYDVRTHPGMTVLEGLHQIREETDATLSWRYSCRMGICGSCAMVINGQPSLVCNTQIQAHVDKKNTLRLQALWNFSIIKDLVCDLEPMFDKHAALAPYLIRGDTQEMESPSGEFNQTPTQLTDYLQFSYCIKCGACMAACPTVAIDPTFLGPMPLTSAQRYNSDSRDSGFGQRKINLAQFHATNHCHFAGECSRVCPKGVDPARAIQRLKRDLVMDLWLGKKRQKAAPVLARPTRKKAQQDIPAPPAFTVER